MTAPQSPPTPTIPPAVAEFDALSPMGRAMLAASRLVSEAEGAGIAVGHVYLDGLPGDGRNRDYIRVRIAPVNPALTQPLAVVCGLTELDRFEANGFVYESFTAVLDGVRASTDGTVPAALAADEPEQVPA